MYSDHANELYMIFLRLVLNDFEKMNLLFQMEEADHCKLLNELESFALVMLRRILCPDSVQLGTDMSFTSIYLPLDKVDSGHEFSSLLAKKRKDRLITEEDWHNIQSRCQKFLIRA